MADEKQFEFEVKDRRRFTSEGETKEASGEAEQPKAEAKPAAPPPPPPAQEHPPEQPSAASSQAARSYAESGQGYEPLTFERLLLMYYQTALLQMGLLAGDPEHPPEVDLLGARETIDVLGLLQGKTRGNLTAQESRILENILYELRMAWMELNRKKK